MKLPADEIKTIAVLRALQLGDMLCVIPALRALHHAYPSATLTLLGLPWAASLVQRFPDYIHAFKHFPGYPGLPEQPFDAREFARFLHESQGAYDMVLQMQGNGTIINPMIECLGAKYTAGFCMPGDYCPDETLFLSYPGSVHEIERHLQLMEYLGVESQGAELEFPLYQQDYEDYNRLGFLLQAGKYVCIHPGSRGAYRQWSPTYFAAIANYCADEGFTIVLTGTADEMDIIDKVVNELTITPVIAAGKTSLGGAAILIRNAFALISNCTGVSHIAAAFKTPSIVISMDGEPERWGPMDKWLHRTIDWTKDDRFDVVLDELKDLFGSLQRYHDRDTALISA